jgi:hypothetical protein
MNINRHNCEAWFLDYYENNLTPNQVTALFGFLDTYPDMRVVFESYEGSVFEDASDFTLPAFEGKELLKKQADLPTGINIANCEDYFIAATEGLLNDAKQKELDLFLTKHQHKKADLELFRTTKLQPDLTIKFDQKQGLKKSPVTISSADFDVYAVAALEGELTSDQQVAFEGFLKTNPSYQTEYTLFTQTKLSPEKAIVFEHKAALKKQNASVTAENIDQFAARSIEGDLNEEDAAALQSYLNTSATAQTAYTHYTQTRLQPDLSIVYAEKNQLKRRERDGVIWFFSSRMQVAAAAAVLLFVMTFWWMITTTPSGSVVVAGNFKYNLKKAVREANPIQNKLSIPVPSTASSDINQTASSGSIEYTKKNLKLPAPKPVNPIENRVDPVDPSTGNTVVNSVAQNNPLKNNTSGSNSISPSQSLPIATPVGAEPQLPTPTLGFTNSGNLQSTPVNWPEFKKEPKSISASQYILRRMKTILDKREQSADIHEEDYELAAKRRIEKESSSHVDGWDIAGSAVDRISRATGWNMQLTRNNFDGTVLSVGKYSVRLSRKSEKS